MNNEGLLVELSALATIFICVMTFITFGITTGMWELDLWQSDLQGASIIGCDGYWGEDIVVTYTDNTTESVKSVYNNYWSKMSIRNDGSKPVSTLQYCLNVLIPVSDVFDTRAYRCSGSIVQDGINFYQTSYRTTGSVDIKANEWTRVITISLDIESVSNGWNDGIYFVSFENTGTIEGINVPAGLSLTIAIEGDEISFLI